MVHNSSDLQCLARTTKKKLQKYVKNMLVQNLTASSILKRARPEWIITINSWLLNFTGWLYNPPDLPCINRETEEICKIGRTNLILHFYITINTWYFNLFRLTTQFIRYTTLWLNDRRNLQNTLNRFRKFRRWIMC